MTILPSGESCFVLQSGPTHSLVANFPSICCLQYDVCKPLMPDVAVPEAHQNRCLRGDGRLPRTIRYIRIYSTNCIEQCMQVIQAWE